MFLIVLEAKRLRSGCQDGGVRAVFWDADFFLHMAGGARKLCWPSFLRALVPFMRAEDSPPNILSLGIRFPAHECGGTYTFRL